MRYLLIIQGDTNDADYITGETWLTEEKYLEVHPMLQRVARAIKNAKHTHRGNNWGRSEYSDRSDRPEVLYEGVLSAEDIAAFDNYVPRGEYGVHSIESVSIHRVVHSVDLLREPVASGIKWRPRGIGIGQGNKVCAITGEPLQGFYGYDASGFVESREDGQALADMFKGRAYLDYRPSEPNWIQVKVAVEQTAENEQRLGMFVSAVRANDNVITPALLTKFFGI